MSVIDLDRLLAEISPEAPSGTKNREYELAYNELETKIKGTPEVEIGGKIVQEAKDPNWQEVQESAVELLTRIHDLRVVMALIRALLHNERFNGLSAGLALLHGLIERYWQSMYPRLKPEDDNDPTERINILAALGEGEDIIDPLKKTPLCTSRAAGQFSLRDIHLAKGKIAPTKNSKSPPPVMSNIEGVFKDCDVDDLQATKAAINASRRHLNSLDRILTEKVGSGSAPEFGKLHAILEEMDAFMEKQLENRVVSKPPASKQTSHTAFAGHPQPAESVSTQTDRPMGMINSRQDVIRSLDQICMYYQQNEPGSPVPLLLKRARRLVEKNFFEIMQDLGLDSAAQIKTLFSKDTQDTS